MGGVAARYGLDRLALGNVYFGDRSQEIGLAELLVSPDSRLVGKTVVDARLRSTTDLVAIGIRRGSDAVDAPVTGVALRPGDTVLVIGPWRAIARLPQGPDRLILLNTPVEMEDVAPTPPSSCCSPSRSWPPASSPMSSRPFLGASRSACSAAST